MAEPKWVKQITAMFNDDKIKVIQAMPEGDSLIVIWIRMLILGEVSNAKGYLRISDNLPYTEEMLAIVFCKPLPVIQLAIKTFKTFGMIKANEEGIYIQNLADNQSEKKDIREYNRLKKAESRERAKQKQLEMSNEEEMDSEDLKRDKSMTSQREVNDKSMTSQKQRSTCQDTKEEIVNVPQNLEDFQEKQKHLDYAHISALYNTICKSLPKVQGMSVERKRKVKALINALNKSKVLMELGPYERLEYIFRLAEESDFLSGRAGNAWCGFDWLVDVKNALKVIEGNYKNKTGSVNHDGNSGLYPEDAGYTSESENDALAAFRANRQREESDRSEL